MAAERRPKSRKSIAHPPLSGDDLSALDQENIGQNVTIAGGLSVPSAAEVASQKKTRSKSLGPGGVDALKEDAGNRRKTPTAHLPKSILKPTVPLSPLREIPSRKPAGGPNVSSPSPKKEPTSNVQPRNVSVSPSRRYNGKQDDVSKTSVREAVEGLDNEDEDAAEAEARVHRQQRRDEIQKQREARRKSMANRRVSFAPEATLHTWDLVDEVQDSTTSSASTNSTRRASSAFGPSSPHPNLRSPAVNNVEESPSTPSTQKEEDFLVQESPAHQRDLHQKKFRRRSSGIPPMNFNNPDEVFSSPQSGSSVAGGDDMANENQESVEANGSSSSSEDEAGSPDDTAMSGMSEESMSEANINQKDGDGTQALDDGEDISMDIAEDTTGNFNPFAKSARMKRTPPPTQQGMGNVDVFAEAFKEDNGSTSGQSPARSVADGEDMSMDITQTAGRILRTGQQKRPNRTAGDKPSNRRQSVRARRRSSGADSIGEGTMDLTTAVGGIQATPDESHLEDATAQTNDISMDLTKAVGGIQKNAVSPSPVKAPEPDDEGVQVNQQFLEEERRASMEFAGGDVDMEMTTALGRIEEDKNEDLGQDVNDGAEMDFTKSVGNILSLQNKAELAQSPVAEGKSVSGNVTARSPLRSAGKAKQRLSVAASETGSPRITPTKPRWQPGGSSGVKSARLSAASPATPSKQLTPQLPRPTTPGKTPPSKNVSLRSPSPKKLFKEEIQNRIESPAAATTPRLFAHDAQHGTHTPSIVLAPKPQSERRTSGVGADRDGLGSPRVATLLDRRTSIGESAISFMPQDVASRGVRFDDPRLLEAEITHARREDERRESGQYIMEHEADAESDEKDATTTLREAIGSMTPRKSENKVKNRKSLAVGSGKGLLGKRPLELDEDDEDADSPNRIEGRETSPVKKIKLQGPAQGDARNLSAKQRRSLAAVSGNDRSLTPTTTLNVEGKIATTPRSQGRFKDAEALPSAQEPLPTLGHTDGQINKEAADAEDKDENIHLQDFLNLTNIRFMDLTTTKRRHPPTPARGATERMQDDQLRAQDDEDDERKKFENTVAAGACTVPMLELFQHSCRELKKYISDGRHVVRLIEAETREENPALFRKYMSATPAERATMDSQFRDMKTNARHLSKGMWYEWRMALLAGLKEGLNSTEAGLIEDERSVQEQESLLEKVSERVVTEHAHLVQERDLLQAQADEVADCDPDELQDARQQILDLDEQIRAAREQLEEQMSILRDAETAIDQAQEAKSESAQAIREAQRLREECRGWSAKEVKDLQSKVEALESRYGWRVSSVSGSMLTMTYREQLELYFDPSAFAPLSTSPSKSSGQSPLRLAYIGDTQQYNPQPLTTTKRFFLQLLRAHLQSITQHTTPARDVLRFVSSGWEAALHVAAEVHALDADAITSCDIVGDESLLIRSMLLLRDVQTKVDVRFEIKAVAQDLEVSMKVSPSARVVYGEQYKEDRMRDFLASKVGGVVNTGDGTGKWVGAVLELRKRLVARGKKN